MARYLALVNTPGYMPWDDDPPIFDTPAEAWDYLRDHRMRAEDDLESEASTSDCLVLLGVLAEGSQDEYDEAGLVDGCGAVYGDTPGYEGDHDLGLVYSVVTVEQRPATAEETAAYLAGQQEFPGAEETEHGLLLPV